MRACAPFSHKKIPAFEGRDSVIFYWVKVAEQNFQAGKLKIRPIMLFIIFHNLIPSVLIVNYIIKTHQKISQKFRKLLGRLRY